MCGDKPGEGITNQLWGGSRLVRSGLLSHDQKIMDVQTRAMRVRETCLRLNPKLPIPFIIAYDPNLKLKTMSMYHQRC